MSRNRIKSVFDRFIKDDEYYEIDRAEILALMPPAYPLGSTRSLRT